MLENENDGPCLVSDRQILRKLAAKRRAFREGDQHALFETLLSCARYQAVIPAWAVDEMLRIETAIETGESVDLNRSFGWKLHSSSARYHKYYANQRKSQIIAALLRRRQEGASFARGDGDVFEMVAREVGVSRPTVLTIYDENRWLKGVRRGCTDNVGFGDIALPRGRRRGRPILSRSQKKKSAFD
jgi:hypothetical protein